VVTNHEIAGSLHDNTCRGMFQLPDAQLLAGSKSLGQDIWQHGCIPGRFSALPGSIHGMGVVCVNSKIISSTTVFCPIVRSTGVILVSGGMLGMKCSL
jgi:hypothetical protein